jgi:hypothetical protein
MTTFSRQTLDQLLAICFRTSIGSIACQAHLALPYYSKCFPNCANKKVFGISPTKWQIMHRYSDLSLAITKQIKQNTKLGG